MLQYILVPSDTHLTKSTLPAPDEIVGLLPPTKLKSLENVISYAPVFLIKNDASTPDVMLDTSN